jgi:sn1-specific diacylglycerol lipase
LSYVIASILDALQWKIIMSSILCCGGDDEGLVSSMSGKAEMEMYELMKQEKEDRYFLHPSDSQIALTSHTPLFPPGKIIHIVRNHPKDTG